MSQSTVCAFNSITFQIALLMRPRQVLRFPLLLTLLLLYFNYASHVAQVATLEALLVPAIVVSVEQDIALASWVALKPQRCSLKR